MISFVDKITHNSNNTKRLFEVWVKSDVEIFVELIKRDGTVRVIPNSGVNIVSFCEMIVECLSPKSNFFKKVAESFQYDINKICKTEIVCVFNYILFTARIGEDALTLHKKWIDALTLHKKMD